ncbi:MAG: flagellar motor switch protein FliG, partial [Candidatus Eiseniibacteriota bacterium]
GLSGIEKCAVLCLALGPKEAGRVLQQLAPEEVEKVSRAISNMPAIDAEIALTVVREFESVARESSQSPRGGAAFAEQMVREALGEERSRGMIEKLRASGAPVGMPRLKSAAPDRFTELLRREHPQTTAYILAHLEPRQALRVVQLLDPVIAADVLLRMAGMEKTSPELIPLVESGIGDTADLSLGQEMSVSGGPALVAQVLNLLGPERSKELLGAIREADENMAVEIEAKMFVFEDLVRLDRKAIQRVLRDVESKDLGLALKGASDELKAVIRVNMTERGAAALEEEMELMGAVKVKDVEAAHTRIIASVRALEQAGEIVIVTAAVDDELLA